jgi:hypothetical protein
LEDGDNGIIRSVVNYEGFFFVALRPSAGHGLLIYEVF